MAGVPQKQFSIVPDLARSPQIADRNGVLAPEWKLFLEQLVQTLQNTLKAEGTVIPQQTTANIAQLTGVESKANIVYDSTTNEFKGNVETAPGVYTWKVFTLV